MSSVFSHITQKWLSAQNENVATDALAYILQSDGPQRGMMKLLRRIVPDLPSLSFRTQQTEGSIRPDMWGYAEANEPRVFVENKFWAGLTENQPVSYLRQLAARPRPTVLLVIGPEKREHTLQRELTERLTASGVTFVEREGIGGAAWSADTQLGPVLATSSWRTVLQALEHEAIDDHHALADLAQLMALCNAADVDAFVPISAEDASDQRAPALIIQLGSLVQAAVDLAVAGGVLSVNGLRPQADWGRIGRYIRMGSERAPGAWIGVHFWLWRQHGLSPIWLKFTEGFGRASEVRPLIQKWAAENQAVVVDDKNGREVAVALRIPAGEEKDTVVKALVDDLRALTTAVKDLPSIKEPQPPADP